MIVCCVVYVVIPQLLGYHDLVYSAPGPDARYVTIYMQDDWGPWAFVH